MDQDQQSLEQELSALRKQFARLLGDDHEPDLPARLDAIRQRIAEVKRELAAAGAANVDFAAKT